MVLEDLNLNDFKLADRRTRLNLSKAKIVIEKLAMFHAATAAMHFKEADIMELHQTSAIEGDDTPLSFFFAVSFQETLLTIQNTEELKEYLPMLDNFDIIERERNVFKRGTDDVFHVLVSKYKKGKYIFTHIVCVYFSESWRPMDQQHFFLL